MATVLDNPFSLFTDRKGDALDQGFIYVGEAGKDPELFPVDLFWDEDLTIPAAQPLRTVAGYIVNPDAGNSAANAFFATGEISVRVKNRLGVQVFYAAVATDLAVLLASSGGSDGVGYQYDSSSISQTVADTVRRERLNLYDEIPKDLWADIEAGANTTDLTPYVMAACQTGRGINVRTGRFRMALNIDWGAVGLSIRGEGRSQQGTVFENVDNTSIITLDASTSDTLGFELEDMWLENRAPGTYTSCDLLKIVGGDGVLQNDKHSFRNLWLYQGRDNIAVYGRCIWPIFEDITSTGPSRDCFHVETDDNVNRFSLYDVVLKGAGRFGLFFKHDFENLATNWIIDAMSTEDCRYGGWRFTGANGLQGWSARACTFENNAKSIATGTAPTIDGVACRKTNVFADTPYLMGLAFDESTFFSDALPGGTNHPDWHVYVEEAGAVEQYGTIDNSRGDTVQVGGVYWKNGLTYGSGNRIPGSLVIDRTAQSVDVREQTTLQNFTPSLAFGGSAAGFTYTNQIGRYTVHGRRVEFTLYISTSAISGTAGEVTIGGIPHAPANITNLSFPLVMQASGLQATAATALVARILPGEQGIRLYRYEAGTETPLLNTDCAPFIGINIGGSYDL